MLGEMFRRNRARIILCYALLLIEFSIFAILPFLMGKAVDSLLGGDWHDYRLYLGISIFALVAGITRRRFDNRAFLRMWARQASEIINRLIAQNVDRTKIVSRSYMVKEFAHFLEFTVPAFVSAAVDMTMAMVMLWVFVPYHIGAVLTGLMLTAVASCYLFSIYINRQEIICQHGREKIADAIMVDDTWGVEDGYEDQRRNYVKFADLDGFCWGTLDILATAAILIVIASSAHAGATAGVIMANLVYCQKLFEKSCFIAQFFKHIGQLKLWTKFLTDEEGVKPHGIEDEDDEAEENS